MQLNVISQQVYYIVFKRIKLFIVFFLFLLNTHLVFSQFIPSDLPGLQLWLKASSGITKDVNDKVSQWDDLSIKGNNAVQSAPAEQPLFLINGGASLNNLPVIDFTNSRMNLPITTTQSGLATVFVVYKVINVNGGAGGYSFVLSLNNGIEVLGISGGAPFTSPSFIGNTGGNGQGFLGINQKDTMPHIVAISYDGVDVSSSSSYQGSFNGQEQTVASTGIFGVRSSSVIGDRGTGNYFFQGKIAEIIVYDVSLSLVDRKKVEKYLLDKYAPAVNLGPDFIRNNFCDTALNASSRFTSYLWSTGATTQTLTINKTGTYSVTVTDVFGYTSSDAVKVSYPGNFTPFAGNTTTICAGSSVMWNTNLSPASSYTFAWSNGATTSAINIAQAGQYSVTVTDSYGCTRASNTLTVTVDNFPQVASLGPDISMCSGNSIGLTAGAGQSVFYAWSTGETTSSIVITATGTSTYTVTVQDGNSCTAKDTINVTVTGTAPAVNFSVAVTCKGDAEQFTDMTVPSVGITSWLWNFGDASPTGSQQNPLHLYADSGTYNVSLTVMNNVGCSQTFSRNIKIYPLPKASFSSSVASLGSNTTLTDMSNSFGYPITNWAWNFDDATSGINNGSTLQNPIHQFSVSGTHNVKLIVQSAQGCMDSVVKMVFVYNTVPSLLPRLSLWLAADNSVVLVGNNVSQWKDISGKGNDAAQSIVNDRPMYVADGGKYLNNLPVIRFSTSRLILPDFFSSSSGKNTTFAVYRIKDISGGNAGFSSIVSLLNGVEIFPIASAGYPSPCFVGKTGGSAGQRFLGIDNKDTIPHLMTVGCDGNDVSLPSSYYGSYNGVNQTIVPTGAIGNRTGSTIGDRDQSGYYLKGDVAEIVIYDTILNLTQRQQVEQYLHNKYAPAVNLGPDFIRNNFCDTILNASDRFVSYLWSTGATTQTLTINKTGTYSVTVTDVFGYTSSDAVNVIYSGNLSPFSGNTTTICYGNSVKWDTQLEKTKYTFLWQDNSTDSVLTITQAGQYSVTVTDLLSCTRASSTLTVTVDNFPQTASLGPDVSMCSGNSIALTQGAAQAVSYVWSTGETTSSIVISNLGINKYNVLAKNAKGCIAKDTITVNVKGVAPTPNFLVNAICQGDKTSFSDLTTVPTPDGIATWSWNFGDGGTSASQNPSHIYMVSGSYTASLSVVSDSGCSAFIQKPVVINPIPNANFNITSSPVCTGANSQFMDISTISSGSMVSWSWDFGDGSTVSVSKNTTHTYTTTGTYNVQHIVTSALGCKDTILSNVSVSKSPSALFTADTVCKGAVTIFKDKSSGIINNWLWNFGDGYNSTLKNATHTFSVAGTYTTSLLVTASNGCKNSVSGVVVVDYLPSPGFKGSTACSNSPLQLIDISTAIGSTVNAWNWQFGIAGTSTIQNPSPVYSVSGTYSISLTATSAQGCFATATQTVSIKPLPVAGFSMTPSYSYPQQEVNFSDLSIGGTKYHWFFGDGGKDSVRNPIHTYQDTGSFSILLVTQNSFGCIDSSIQHISVDIPVLDIQLSYMFAIKSSNTVLVSALLKNTGTLDVTTIELSAYLNDGTPIREFWTGLIRPDSVITYSFHSSFELINNIQSIVCVEVKKVNGQIDNVASNNKKCYSITDEFTLLNPFPNPTGGDISFLFVVPDASLTRAQVFDSRGRLVATPFDGNASKGLNQIIFDTINLEKGMYVFKISNKNKVITKMFVKK